MPFFLGLLAFVAGIAVWIYRARAAAEVTHEILDAASDVMAAARRFGFRRRNNRHPADDIEDPKIAVGGIGVAFLELEGMPTAEGKKHLQIALAKHTRVSTKDAEELMVLGHWLMGQCNGPQPAIERLSRTLQKTTQAQHFETVMAVLQDVAAANPNGLSNRQREALPDIQRAFKIS